jgi:hypothetical protein
MSHEIDLEGTISRALAKNVPELSSEQREEQTMAFIETLGKLVAFHERLPQTAGSAAAIIFFMERSGLDGVKDPIVMRTILTLHEAAKQAAGGVPPRPPVV